MRFTFVLTRISLGLACLAAGILAAGILAAGLMPAAAGEITAKANITFCEVEAVDCINSDLDSCQLIFNSALGAGEAIKSDTGSLCYRRNTTPGDCASNLQTKWSCITNFVEAPKKYAIQ